MAETTNATDSTWTVILAAKGVGQRARAALGELIRRYENYVTSQIRRRGHPPDISADDLKQQFFMEILGRDDISKLERTPQGHGFRAWLQLAIRHFLYNQWDKWHAQHSGRDKTTNTTFDTWQATTAEDIALAVFALDTLQHVLDRHQRETPNKARFQALKRFLPGPQMDLEDHAKLASSLGLTRNALAQALSNLRLKHRELLREAVADTLERDDCTSESEWEATIDREVALLGRSLLETPLMEVRELAPST
jgi:DNA-directed RNA polymerase specialized sigma24 family protein